MLSPVRWVVERSFAGRYVGYDHSVVHGLYGFRASLDAPMANPNFHDALGAPYVGDTVLERALVGRFSNVKWVGERVILN